MSYRKFDFEYDDEYLQCHEALSPEQRMWVNIIRQAFIDASSTSRKACAKRLRAEAYEWLTSGSDDFRSVLYYAGFDGDNVDLEKIAKRIFATLSDGTFDCNQFRGNRRNRFTKKNGRGREI